MTQAGVNLLKKKKKNTHKTTLAFYSYLRASPSSCRAIFRLLSPFLSATLPAPLPLLLPLPLALSFFPRSSPSCCTHAGWSARYVVLFNMHGPFLLLYYCPTGGEGPFLWPDNGRRRDREHGGHVPFATPRYLSILPPFSPDPLSAFQ